MCDATNDHLKTFWEKAVTLYNDPNVSYTSRVYPEYGKPLDKSYSIPPVAEEYHMHWGTSVSYFVVRHNGIASRFGLAVGVGKYYYILLLVVAVVLEQ